MPDLYSTTLGQNTRKVKPNSGFIPKLTPVMVYNDDFSWTEENDADNYLSTSQYQANNSRVFRAVQAIQQFCEVFEVGNNSFSGTITMMCRDSSIPYDAGTDFNNEGADIAKLTQALTLAFPGEFVYARVGLITDDDTDG
jgi:hypothetical protein